MKTAGARAIAWVAVALLAVGALRITTPLPERRPAELLDGASFASGRVERIDTLERGETLGALLARGGLSTPEVNGVLGAATTLDARRVPAGMTVTIGQDPTDSVPRFITLRLGVDRLLHLSRSDSGWVSREERLPWTVDTMVVNGRIASSLYDALEKASAPLTPSLRTELAWEVADIFDYRLDMSRDLQPGDAFSVLLERNVGPAGAMRVGRVLAVEYASGKRVVDAIRHESSSGGVRYYDQDGRSMEATFLRAPLQFRRISSVFGMRKHPILGVWRQHKGTDYSAASGTPVRAIGDGVVAYAGWKGGFGNVIEIRHGNGALRRYGHLRGFAKGVRRGVRVSIGETVAYVGATGLATAPHLHFEVLVGGVQKNPRTALDYQSGAPLDASERARFNAAKSRYLALIQRDAPIVAVNENN